MRTIILFSWHAVSFCKRKWRGYLGVLFLFSGLRLFSATAPFLLSFLSFLLITVGLELFYRQVFLDLKARTADLLFADLAELKAHIEALRDDLAE